MVDQRLGTARIAAGKALVEFVCGIQKVRLVPLQHRHYTVHKVSAGFEGPAAAGAVPALITAHVYVHGDFCNRHLHRLGCLPQIGTFIGHAAGPCYFGQRHIQQGRPLHGKRVQAVERRVSGDVLHRRFGVGQHVQDLDSLDLLTHVGRCGVGAERRSGSIGELLQLVECQGVQAAVCNRGHNPALPTS